MEDEAALDTYLFDRERRPPIEPPGALGRGGTSAPSGGGVPVAFEAADGHRLAGSMFLPRASAEAPSRATLIASATGVLRGYYARFASYLAEHGRTVLTVDYRGIGESRHGSARASDATMRAWGELDLSAALDWLVRTTGVSSVDYVGHSVGGQLLGRLAVPERIGRAVLVGSQSGEVRLWPAPERWRMTLYMYGLIPGITSAVGYLPGTLGIGEDLPPGVAQQWARWCRTRDYFMGVEGPSLRQAYARVRAPILAFGFDDDPYAPRRAIEALLAFYPNAPKHRRRVRVEEARVGHFGFFRPRWRDSFWREAREFLDGR
jgi:predicted alpha/beta hydrolase